MRMGVIGGGWRADFFLRVARALPEEFTITGVARTSEEKAALSRAQWGVPAFSRVEDLLDQAPDFVVLSVPRAVAPGILTTLMERGVPALCETPPAADLQGLRGLWEAHRRFPSPVLVAEQYFLQPYHSSMLRLTASGALGKVVSMRNSMAHGYHGINLMRRYLGVGMENCRIRGGIRRFPIVKTADRSGADTSGRMSEYERQWAVFDFDGGAVGSWDFTGEQYHSHIRSRHLSVEGTRGEITDTTARWLDEGNEALEVSLRRVESGPYSDLEGLGLRELTLGERRIWKNPFPGARLSDDELAVAGLMRSMRLHLEQGQPLCYPLREALQDSYLALVLEEALRTGEAASETQCWAED